MPGSPGSSVEEANERAVTTGRVPPAAISATCSSGRRHRGERYGGVELISMTPDVWADYNQIDDDGHVVAYLEDIVRSARVVVGRTVVVADP